MDDRFLDIINNMLTIGRVPGLFDDDDDDDDAEAVQARDAIVDQCRDRAIACGCPDNRSVAFFLYCVWGWPAAVIDCVPPSNLQCKYPN